MVVVILQVTQALDAAWLQVCRLDPAGPSLDSSGAVFLLPQRQRMGSELSVSHFANRISGNGDFAVYQWPEKLMVHFMSFIKENSTVLD